MLRRVLEGAGLIFLIVLAAYRIDIGFMIPLLAIGGVVAFTVWRIRNLWRRYQAVQVAQRAPVNPAVENEMLALRGHQHGRGAELTFWTGFMLGGAMLTDTPVSAGEGSDMGIGVAEGGMDIGGGFGGDL